MVVLLGKTSRYIFSKKEKTLEVTCGRTNGGYDFLNEI